MRTFGMYGWFGPDVDRHAVYGRMKTRGFTSTALDIYKDGGFVHNGEAAECCAAVRATGLEIAYVHASFANAALLWSPDELGRARIKSEYCTMLRLCGANGIPVLVIHPGTGTPCAATPEGLDILREIVGFAAGENVILAVENTRQPQLADTIFEKIESSHLGFCYDSSHDFLYSDEPGALLVKWGHRLAVTHLSDNDGKSDGHLLPGEGVIGWKKLAGLLPASYQGPVFLELIPTPAEQAEPEAYVDRAWVQARWMESVLSTVPV